MEFVECKILKRYNAFDAAHNINHAKRVMDASVKLARKLGADLDMAYVVAAYHDLGLEKERATHHLESGKILKADKRLERWFSQQQIETMKQAVEDHRASASHAPRNIYGKIVAEADRDLEPMSVFRRTVAYGLEHYPEKSPEEHWERFMQHMQQKYSTAGYIKLWIPGSDNENNLRELRIILNDDIRLRRIFEELYQQLTS